VICTYKVKSTGAATSRFSASSVTNNGEWGEARGMIVGRIGDSGEKWR